MEITDESTSSGTGSSLRLPGDGFSIWIGSLAGHTADSPSLESEGVRLPGDGFSLWSKEGGDCPMVLLKACTTQVRLPGDGFSVWIGPTFAEAHLMAPPVRPQSVSLPGDGFSLWTRPMPLAIPASAAAVRLPGAGFSLWSAQGAALVADAEAAFGPSFRPPGHSFSLWTQPYAEDLFGLNPAGIDALRPTAFVPAPGGGAVVPSTFSAPSSSTPSSPSLLSGIMKSFGIVKWIAAILLVALLFAFLGGQSEIEKLEAKNAKLDQELVEKANAVGKLTDELKGSSTQLDSVRAELSQVTASSEAKASEISTLKGQLADSQENDQALQERLKVLSAAKEAVEKSLGTQMANQEIAYGELEKVKKALELNLQEVSSKLDATIAEASANATKLTEGQEALRQEKAALEEKLAAAVKALEEAKSRADEMNEQLDAAQKERSDLQKKIEELNQALEAKEKEVGERAADAEQALRALDQAKVHNDQLVAKLSAGQAIDGVIAVDNDATVTEFIDGSEEALFERLQQELLQKKEMTRFLETLKGEVQSLRKELADVRGKSHSL